MLLDLRIGQLAEQCLQGGKRPFLVRAHQARIPRHIGGQNRGETADSGHSSPDATEFPGQFIAKLTKVPRLLVGERRSRHRLANRLRRFLAVTRRSRSRYIEAVLLPWAFSARPN
jgi:hypothetical protein